MSTGRSVDWLAWRQLLRAANVFTAVSNVIAGFLLVQREWEPLGPLLLLMLASALLYEAGMVLNDVCDADLDAAERPERPIPSGRVNKQSALRLGIALIVGGIVAAVVVSLLVGQWIPAQIAFALAATIVGYNAGVKSTAFGPLAMGACRMLNVLLGASVGANLSSLTEHATVWAYAGFVGVYTMGITWLARKETTAQSGRWQIKAMVSTLIQMFIVWDALASTLAAGWISGLVVLSLLIPTRLLARKLPMT